MLSQWWERLTEELKNGDKKSDRTRGFQWLILLGCVSVAVMLISSFVSVRHEVIQPREPPPETEETAAAPAIEDDSIARHEERMAAALASLLEKVVGLEQVEVQMNLKSTEVIVLEKNVIKRKQVTEEEDREGGQRTVTDTDEDSQVVTIQGKHGEEPIVIQRLKPDVKGILIVAKGVENLQVKEAVMKAVRAYLDVPPHKIAILPKG